MRLWLHLADGRVLALRYANLTSPDDRAIAPAVAALAGDPRGVRQGLQLPDIGYVHVLYGAPLAPPPAIDPRTGRIQGNLFWSFDLDGAVIAALSALRGHKFFLSLRNYNRLATLPPEQRERRLQALRRFPALVAPILLTAHQYPNCFDGQRHARRHADAAVEEAIDRGRDLIGALARHYGISRGLVRAPLNAVYWEAGYEMRRGVLAFLDALPANKRPHSAAELLRDWPALQSYFHLLGEDGEDRPLPPVLASAHACAFTKGWRPTWAHIHARHAPPQRALRAAEDFLEAACLEAAQLARRWRGPGRRRMAAAWIVCHGLIGLLRDSARWHAWRPEQAACLLPDLDRLILPAILGRHEEKGYVAEELLTAADLEWEGVEMRHCVGSYWSRCVAGERIVRLRAPDGRRATAHYCPAAIFGAGEPDWRYRTEQLAGPCNAEVGDDLERFAETIAAMLNVPERRAAREAAVRFEAKRHKGRLLPKTPGLDPEGSRRLKPVLGLLGYAPASPEVLLIAYVAGFEYHAGPQLEAQGWRLAAGERLRLTPEPDNPHDAQAIRIDWQGHKLGYVPRPENAPIAAALAAGRPLSARVAHHDPDGAAWRRLEFVIEEDGV